MRRDVFLLAPFALLFRWLGLQEPEQEPKEKAHSEMTPTEWVPECWCGRKGVDVILMQEGVYKCNSQPSAHTFADPNWEPEHKEEQK